MLRLPKIPQFAAGKHTARSAPKQINEATPMLAEKFILLMETLKSRASPDGAPWVVSASPHVPVKLPAASPITAT